LGCHYENILLITLLTHVNVVSPTVANLMKQNSHVPAFWVATRLQLERRFVSLEARDAAAFDIARRATRD
jgi:hypothetical protein